jgi:hypothetical protein
MSISQAIYSVPLKSALVEEDKRAERVEVEIGEIPILLCPYPPYISLRVRLITLTLSGDIF